jgi:mannosyl-3-phosphoglycerate phosphatase
MTICVFTDLDGTLLDHHTYDWTPARSALERLKRHNIPLVMTTSKTWAEVFALKQTLGNHHPAIVENGGCVYYPKSQTAHSIHDYKKTTLGASRAEIHRALDTLPATLRQAMRTFEDMSVAEIGRETGLDEESAIKARQRDSSEPFLWSGSGADPDRLEGLLSSHALKVVKGGRFYHIVGLSDKSDGLEHVREILSAQEGQALTAIALGDGSNDITMLEEADYAIVIPNPSGHVITFYKDETHFFVAEKPGPEGWNQSLNKLLNHLNVPE